MLDAGGRLKRGEKPTEWLDIPNNVRVLNHTLRRCDGGFHPSGAKSGFTTLHSAAVWSPVWHNRHMGSVLRLPCPSVLPPPASTLGVCGGGVWDLRRCPPPSKSMPASGV